MLDVEVKLLQIVPNQYSCPFDIFNSLIENLVWKPTF